ncbi:MAG: hypothetical protein M1831_000599 [Alyxoria varia]|nr:MAG: hypothetical protein M1831_000599 [Alyxoria varia]
MNQACSKKVLQSLSKSFPLASRPCHHLTSRYLSSFTQPGRQLSHHVVKPLALTAFTQKTALARRYASDAPPTPHPMAAPGTYQRLDKEAHFRSKKWEVDPEGVTSTSSTIPIFSGSSKPSPDDEEDVDMLAGIKSDIDAVLMVLLGMQKTFRETFALHEVPPQAIQLGLAGVLPYLATSTATFACAFELNNASHHGGDGFVLSEATAETLLHILEPLQVGYGAVILSFLGAIHWGLEWAGYGGQIGYRRYAIGVGATAVAWPTMLMPVEYALISQFLAFNMFYTVDAKACTNGWTPPWYSSYRFILTFIVGSSLVLSLIGRGQVVHRIEKAPTAADRVKELGDGGEAHKKRKRAKKE